MCLIYPVNQYVTWMILGLPVLAQDTLHRSHIPHLGQAPTLIESTGTFYWWPLLVLIILLKHANVYSMWEALKTAPAMCDNDPMKQKIMGEMAAAMWIVVRLKSPLKVWQSHPRDQTYSLHCLCVSHKFRDLVIAVQMFWAVEINFVVKLQWPSSSSRLCQLQYHGDHIEL